MSQDLRSPALDGETSTDPETPPLVARPEKHTGYSSSSSDDDRLTSGSEVNLPPLQHLDTDSDSSDSGEVPHNPDPKPLVETVDGDSDDDEAPPLTIPDSKQQHVPEGKTSFNSKAKEATGIDYPTKRRETSVQHSARYERGLETHPRGLHSWSLTVPTYRAVEAAQ